MSEELTQETIKNWAKLHTTISIKVKDVLTKIAQMWASNDRAYINDWSLEGDWIYATWRVDYPSYGDDYDSDSLTIPLEYLWLDPQDWATQERIRIADYQEAKKKAAELEEQKKKNKLEQEERIVFERLKAKYG